MRLSPRIIHLIALSLVFAGCDNETKPDDTAGDTDTGTVIDTSTPDDTAEPDTGVDFGLVSMTAEVDGFVEHDRATVDLTASYSGSATHHSWSQLAGPAVAIDDRGPEAARLDVSTLDVAAPTELVFQVEASGAGEPETLTATILAWPADLEPLMGENVQIGGSTWAAATLHTETNDAILYSVGNRLSVTPLSGGEVTSIYLPGFIQEITLVNREGVDYALIAMSDKGIAVVSLSDPFAPELVTTVAVNFFQDGISFAEGGGDILVDNEIAGASGTVSSLATDGETLWIADESYGLHATALSNLIAPEGPALEKDGTLLIDSEVYTLQYAGEVAWGGPRAISLVDDRLFVAQGFLGLVIYDASTLDRVGAYNLYTDTNVVEDWFIDEDVSALVQSDPKTGEPYLDAVTGMPDYRQANFEIQEVWHGEVDAPSPWADFDRYGKYYYQAHAIDVQSFGPKTIAYVAYGLGGLVAVNVTGFSGATSEIPLQGRWLGYVPAVPANGPDTDEAFGDSESLYPHHGAGMLKEAGVVDVKVVDQQVWFADHFAGFLAVGDAATPELSWHGPDGAGAYDNDDPSLGDGVLGDHWPDYEFVTSYDMSPWDPKDHESLPICLYEAPVLVASGEVTGHGGPLHFVEDGDLSSAGGADLLQCSGSGGLNVIDIVDVFATDSAARFSLLTTFPTTDEVGAAADGSATEMVQIGHAQGIAASENYLYVGDGPHGVSAWLIADGGVPIDDLHLVGNTVADEYPVEVDGELVYPMTHASVVYYDGATESVFSLSQSIGLRRADVSDVELGVGEVGSPLLFAPEPTDLFEHNGEWGRYEDMKGQDHAYDVALKDGLAYVADGTNGITIYDLSKDPTDLESGFVVGNYGNDSGKPGLGRTTGVSLWSDPMSDTEYAFVAAGPYGVGVLDITDPSDPVVVKLFEPIKLEDDTLGKADGRCVDAHAIDDVVYFSYSSYGIVSFSIADMIEPLPEGVDPTDIWSKDGPDYRPEALARVELTDIQGYEDVDYEALYMEPVQAGESLWFYVAGGPAGLMVWDWSDPGAPLLVSVADTVGEATGVAIANGRVYVADHSGGVAAYR